MDPHKGLSNAVPDWSARVETYGANIFEERKLTPYWRFIFEHLKEKNNWLLFFMATLEILVKGTTSTGIELQESFAEAGVRYLTMIIMVNFAVFLDWKRERMF